MNNPTVIVTPQPQPTIVAWADYFSRLKLRNRIIALINKRTVQYIQARARKDSQEVIEEHKRHIDRMTEVAEYHQLLLNDLEKQLNTEIDMINARKGVAKM